VPALNSDFHVYTKIYIKGFEKDISHNYFSYHEGMFVIKNVKVSVKLESIELKHVISYFNSNLLNYKDKSNYIILNNKFMYIFYKCKNGLINHLNVTKISKLSDIDVSLDHLKNNIFKNFPINEKTVKVDNITAVHTINRQINLSRLANKIRDLYRVNYNNEKFPGLFVKFSPCGTLIIFHTGKIISIGCKSELDLQRVYNELLNITKDEIENV